MEVLFIIKWSAEMSFAAFDSLSNYLQKDLTNLNSYFLIFMHTRTLWRELQRSALLTYNSRILIG